MTEPIQEAVLIERKLFEQVVEGLRLKADDEPESNGYLSALRDLVAQLEAQTKEVGE